MEDVLRIDSRLTDRDDNGYIYWQGKLFTGFEVSYYDNGQLEEEIEYVDGVPDGQSRLWYKNGQLRCEDFYKKGCIHGFVREWYESGPIKIEDEIYNGVAISKKEWNEQGILIKNYKK
jgi:antitoxin component YwqK of YwqJK toxin-antitoxin module